MVDTEINQNEFINQIDRIKKSNKRKLITKISLVSALFLMLIVYLFTPLSQVRTLNLKGNLNFDEQEILDISSLKRNSSLYFINDREIEKKLNENPLIKSSDVKVSLGGVKVIIEELTPVIKSHEDYYMNDGSKLNRNLLNNPEVGDHLNEIIPTLPSFIGLDSTLEKNRIENFSKIYFSLTQEEREYIKHVRFFEDNSSQLAFFYECDKFNYEVVTEIPMGYKNFDHIAKIFKSESLGSYGKSIFGNDENMSKLTLQNLEIDGASFEYYSIKVIMDIVPNSKPNYRSVLNNTSASEK